MSRTDVINVPKCSNFVTIILIPPEYPDFWNSTHLIYEVMWYNMGTSRQTWLYQKPASFYGFIIGQDLDRISLLYVYWIYRREQKLWIPVLQSILHNCLENWIGVFIQKIWILGWIIRAELETPLSLYIDFRHAVISNLTYSTNSITSYLPTYLNHSLRRMFNSVHSIGNFMRLLMAPRPSLLLYPISILENRMEASQDSNTANN